MKIIINAYNLRIGGGETIGLGVIQSLYQINDSNEYHVFIPRHTSYLNFSNHQKVHIHFGPLFFTQTIIGRLFINLYLIKRIKGINPDAIFSMGNYTIPIKIKQLLLLHWPYAVYPESIAWEHMSSWSYLKRKIRTWWVKRGLKYATMVTVQTSLMKMKFLQHYNFAGPVEVNPTTNSPVLEENLNSRVLKKIREVKEGNKSAFFLICISKYYSHKNLEILIPLAEKIREQGKQIKILVNLDPLQGRPVRRLLRSISKKKLSDFIISLGPIPQEDLYSTYKSADAFFLPTLLESFGIIYCEAMIAGLPIFTSDLPFAREMCGDSAFYFNPLDVSSIYHTVVEGMENPETLRAKAETGEVKAKKFKSWEEITQTYVSFLEK